VPVKQKARAILPLFAQALLTNMPFADTGRREFHLPEIAPDDHIQYHGQKLENTIQNAAGINYTINGGNIFLLLLQNK
jgi:hypothetical protein